MKIGFVAVVLLTMASRAVSEEPVTVAWKLVEGDEFEFHMFWNAELGPEDKRATVKRDLKGTIKVEKPAEDGTLQLLLTLSTFEGSTIDEGKETSLDEDERDVAGVKIKIPATPTGKWNFDNNGKPIRIQWTREIRGQIVHLLPELPAAAVKVGDTWSSEQEAEKSTWTLKQLETADGKNLAVLSGKHTRSAGTSSEMTGESEIEFDVKAGYLKRCTKTLSIVTGSPWKLTRTVELQKK